MKNQIQIDPDENLHGLQCYALTSAKKRVYKDAIQIKNQSYISCSVTYLLWLRHKSETCKYKTLNVLQNYKSCKRNGTIYI